MKKLLLLFLTSLFIVSCDSKVGLPPAPIPPPTAGECDSIKYSVDVEPILYTYCVGCHNSGSVNFMTYATTKMSVDNGTLRSRVLVVQDMPLLNAPLSEGERKKIECWLDKGAPNN